MKNAIRRTLVALGTLLLMVSGTALAQTPAFTAGSRGQAEPEKSAQLCGGIPQAMQLGQNQPFNGFIQNTGNIPLNNVVMTLSVTNQLALSNYTTDKGQWAIQQPLQGRLEAGTLQPNEQVNFSFLLTAVAPGQATTIFNISFEGGPPGGQEEQCVTIIEDVPPPPNFIEHDVLEATVALVQLVGGPLGDVPVPFVLRGRTEIDVFFEGPLEGDAKDDDDNGLDEVETEIVALSLTGGGATLRLNPRRASRGQIEELVNNNPGWLDLDPFHDGDANSFFDVFFEIEVAGLVLQNQEELRIEAVIREKPPFERYVHLIPANPIELFTPQGAPTGIFIVKAVHNTGIVEVDIMEQTTALVQLVGGPLGNEPVPFVLRGSAEAHVFFEGREEGDAQDDDDNGLDEVETELVSLNLTGGGVTLSTNPQRASVGQIEELVNNNPGWLDLDPFHDGDANSFFDVFFQIEGGGLVLHNEQAIRIESRIREKPPFERYIHLIPPNPIELFDANNRPTGIFIVKAVHNTGIVEVDIMEQTTALVQLVGGPLGNEPVPFVLRGSAEAHVFFEGREEGDAQDDDNNGLDEVDTELVSLDLTGGGVTLSTNPQRASVGQIEEVENNHPGWLDLDPFHPGDADSFFDVFFQIEVSGLVLHNLQALRIEARIREKPPFERYVHIFPPSGFIELFDANNRPTGIFIVKAEHNTGFVEVDRYELTTALLQLQGGPFPAPTPFILQGPAEVNVFFEGNEGAANDDNDNGLDEVGTELVSLDLTGSGVRLTLNPNQASLGEIEEKEQNNEGWLDLDPFHPGDADSFFDVFFEIEVPDGSGGTIRLHNGEAFRIAAMIRKKPPIERYIHLTPPSGPIELLDENNRPTGIFIVKAEHFTGRVKIDRFKEAVAEVELSTPLGTTEVVVMRGPIQATSYFEGPNEGDCQDDDGDRLCEFETEIVSLNMTGTSSIGPVIVRLNPDLRSVGQVKEQTNNMPGTVDVPPYGDGLVDSFFDLYFEVEFPQGKNALILHNEEPLQSSALFSELPPKSDETYTSINTVPLLDPDGQASGFTVLSALNTPNAGGLTGIVRLGQEVPEEYEIGPNYPNPFRQETVIPFGVPRAEHVKIEVYDLLGRRVATLLDELVPAGRHEATWRATALPAGLYVVRMTAGAVVQTQRVTLTR